MGATALRVIWVPALRETEKRRLVKGPAGLSGEGKRPVLPLTFPTRDTDSGVGEDL